MFTGDARLGAWRRWPRRLTRFIATRGDIGGVIGAGGSGGTALVTAGMRALPVGLPKLMVSTLASGDVGAYVGVTDIAMMYSVTDIAGLNRITARCSPMPRTPRRHGAGCRGADVGRQAVDRPHHVRRHHAVRAQAVARC